MSVDALSEVLRAVRLSGSLFFRVELTAPYAVVAMGNDDLMGLFRAGADHVMPFHLVTDGAIWFDVEDQERVELQLNDIIVLPHGTTHTLTDRPGRRATPAGALRHKVKGDPPTLTHGGGGDRSSALCGFLRCSGHAFGMLKRSLPSVMVIREGERTSWLAATLQRALTEGARSGPGAAALTQRLSETLFADVVQAQLEHGGVAGWLAGLGDPVVGRALALLHGEPTHPWTVDELGRRVGASRSTLAERFRGAVGVSPIKYLTAWRMELAANRLLSRADSVAEVAGSVGYESEASFNRAFKRHVGEPPASWRRARARAVGRQLTPALGTR